MTTLLRRACPRPSLVASLVVVVLTATGSSLVMGGRLSLSGGAANRNQVAVPAGSIVRVDVTGAKEGKPVNASAYGIIVDPTGLIMAPAVVVKPTAPGVGVGWVSPFLGYDVTQIVVNTSTAPGQPFTPAYSASVAAVDGILDVAVLKLDGAIDATTGATTAIPPGSLNLPAVTLATGDPQIGAPIVLATYPETGTSPTGAGTYTEIPGTVTKYATNVHLPGKNWWLNTDIVTPVVYPGGAFVDSSGGLVAMGSWRSGSPPEHAYGSNALLAAPVIAAAKAGTAYTSPYLVPGTRAEAVQFNGWGTADPPCTTSKPVSSYPTGTSLISMLLGYSGFTDGEDYLNLWFDPDKQQVIVYGLHQWTFGAQGACFAPSLKGSTNALPDGTYGYNLFAGGDLHFLKGAKTTIGQPAAGGVKVTGRILDSDTGKPVPFVFVYILKPGVDPQKWLQGGTQAEVASSGLSDEQGLYVTDPPIQPGKYPFLMIPFDKHHVVGGTVTIPADGKLPDVSLTPTT